MIRQSRHMKRQFIITAGKEKEAVKPLYRTKNSEKSKVSGKKEAALGKPV